MALLGWTRLEILDSGIVSRSSSTDHQHRGVRLAVAAAATMAVVVVVVESVITAAVEVVALLAGFVTISEIDGLE